MLQYRFKKSIGYRIKNIGYSIGCLEYRIIQDIFTNCTGKILYVIQNKHIIDDLIHHDDTRRAFRPLSGSGSSACKLSLTGISVPAPIKLSLTQALSKSIVSQ